MTTQTDLDAPWSLHFDRDGTEDIAIICDSDGNDLAHSRHFWLPEAGDPIPTTLASMRAMAAAPRLLASLITCANLPTDYDESDGKVGEAYREALVAINEATGRLA
ncbi:MAG: hypothetical protein ABSG53_02510 [Thermoguttaceae bacterium]|jgi:hypothetical protein